ncbi:MAG: efflux RND transporter periplasmic adaptor subunit [Thermoguttaceae bacterium]
MRRFVLLALLVVFFGCAKPAPSSVSPQVLSEASRGDIKVVRAGNVEMADMEMVTNYPAIVRAFDTTPLYFRVGGPLVDVKVESGSHVQAGDVLMCIDPRDYRNDVATTQATLDAATAKLAAMKVAREEDIRLLEAAAKAAEATAHFAKQELIRYGELFAKQTISSSEYEAKQSEAILAEARLASATEELAKAKLGARAEDVAAAEADIRALKTRLQVASNSLSDTELRAPYSGIVIERLANNHEIVAAREKRVVLMQDISKLKIDIYVAERELSRLAASGTDASSNIEVDVVFNAFPDRRFRAKLGEIVTAPDANTQTYRVTFILDAPKDISVFPGMTAEVFLNDAVLAGTGAMRVMTVPVAAVVGTAEGGFAVWKIDAASSTPVRTPIERGRLLSKNRYVVTRGLKEGDRVVTDGARFLSDGIKIEIEER